MSASATVQVRIDPQLKARTEQILQEMGLTMTTAFTLMCRQILNQRKLPFEVVAAPLQESVSMNATATFEDFKKLRGIIPADLDCNKALEESRLERYARTD